MFSVKHILSTYNSSRATEMHYVSLSCRGVLSPLLVAQFVLGLLKGHKEKQKCHECSLPFYLQNECLVFILVIIILNLLY